MTASSCTAPTLSTLTSTMAASTLSFDCRKYQLMIDKNTLVAKVSPDCCKKFILPLVEDRWKQLTGFLKKVPMFENIPITMLYEISKHMHSVDYQAGTPIIKRNEKNQHVYFIVSGEV